MYKFTVNLLAFFAVLGLYSCRLSEYKVNYAKVPAIELEWLNPLGDDYRNVIYTGEMPLQFRLSSQYPMPKNYTLKISYQDGYTNKRNIIAENQHAGGNNLDTTFSITTKKNIGYYNDNRMVVRALVRSGKYGTAYSEFFRLGVPLPILVRRGNVSYTDSLGRRFLFGGDVVTMSLPDSTYKIPLNAAQQDSLIYYIKNILPDSTQYTESSQEVISIKQGVRLKDISIKKDSKVSRELLLYLRNLFQIID